MEISLIDIGKVVDERGELNFIDLQSQIPFTIKNFFFIKNVPQNKKRGCHSNQKTHEILIMVSGSLEVKLNKKKHFKLTSNNNKGLLIPSQNWIELYNFSNDAICVVLGSESYDEDEKKN